MACERSDVTAVKMLIASGADVNSDDNVRYLFYMHFDISR